MTKKIYKIRGMHCRSCEILIEGNISEIPGVKKVKVDHKKGVAEVEYEQAPVATERVAEAIREAGYEIGEKADLSWISRNPRDYLNLLLGLVVLGLFYLFGSESGLFQAGVDTSQGGLGVALLVGLVAGVSSCMALIGGLVLGVAARYAENHPEATAMQKFRPHIFFNLGRVVGYAVLGGVIGMAGAVLQPSAFTMGILTLAVGGVMIFLGLKLVEIFPKLQEVNLTLPKSVSRLLGIRQGGKKEYSHHNAFLAGALTFFLPCGFTQAMQLYAISTGSVTQGAMIMGLFALGTAPGLLGVGGLAAAFKGWKARLFFATAGLAVIFLGVFNIANASRVVFAPQASVIAPVPSLGVVPGAEGEAQVVQMTQGASGYSPNQFTVQVGRKVRWVINSTNQYTCAAYISMPAYGVNQPLKVGENVIEFTPTVTGEIPFTCSMGMYRGKFLVVDGPTGAVPAGLGGVQVAQAANSGNLGGGCSARGGGGCGGCGMGRAYTPQAGNTEVVSPVRNGVSNGVNPATPAVAVTAQVIRAVYTQAQDISPNSFSVRLGQLVRVEIDARDNGSGCMSTVMVPGLYNQPQFLAKGTTVAMEFTPTQKGEYPITCAMGVKRGVISVI